MGRKSNYLVSNKLSPREIEVLRYLCWTNPQAAKCLYISKTTIASYCTSIFLKLGVSTRAAAIIKSVKLGILTVDDFVTEVKNV